MKAAVWGTAVAAVAAAGLLLGGSAQAMPVFISQAQSTGGGVYIELRVRPQGGTRCKVNLAEPVR
jgi:hypothetical protein